MRDNFTEVHNKNELAFGYMNFLISICIDVKEEAYAKTRSEKGIEKAEFDALEQINIQFGGLVIDGNNIETYNEEYIIKSGIRNYLLQTCNV